MVGIDMKEKHAGMKRDVRSWARGISRTLLSSMVDRRKTVEENFPKISKGLRTCRDYSLNKSINVS